MKKTILIIIGVLLIAIPAFAYFGGNPFGTAKFGTGAFGSGPFGEGVTSDMEYESGDLLLLPNGIDNLLLPNGVDKLLIY